MYLFPPVSPAIPAIPTGPNANNFEHGSRMNNFQPSTHRREDTLMSPHPYSTINSSRQNTATRCVLESSQSAILEYQTSVFSQRHSPPSLHSLFSLSIVFRLANLNNLPLISWQGRPTQMKFFFFPTIPGVSMSFRITLPYRPSRGSPQSTTTRDPTVMHPSSNTDESPTPRTA